ncbi:DnaJ-domain-containing protein [Phellopilus nigrolimitatus]|nr:DnaJ-domain-containing protein [Phellopilus nigrolimitatus]
MDHEDPITQFFPGQEDVNLYSVLSLDATATPDAIKKAYRRLALVYHPDKHARSSEETRADASLKFQQVGFAYAVLSDDKRRVRYDKTGRTDEGFDLQAGEDGWDAYFADLFDRVTKGKLDELKKEYQGSAEEVADIKRAYLETDNTIGEIMSHIPHSNFNDEARFIRLITQLISNGELKASKAWEKSIRDGKAKLVRKKQGEAEATEAEELAKELGIWDEFYGSGKVGPSKGKAKSKTDDPSPSGDDEDHSALQALILKKKKNMDGFFDTLATKYAEGEPKTKGKRSKKRASAGEDSQPAGKKFKAAPPEIDDEDFEKLQQKLFGDRAKEDEKEAGGKATKSAAKGRKSRKAK